MRKFKQSPALVVSIIALVFALTGGAYAAGAKLINGSSIKDGTVAATKLTKAARNSLQGDRGPRGATGAKGATGAAGATGAVGPTGATGAAGPQGAKGDTGAAGADGARGATGATGAAGGKGDTGAQGAQGDPGPAGRDGADGRDGVAQLFLDESAFKPSGTPGIALTGDDIHADLADQTGGLEVRRLTLPAGTYKIDASMSVRPPAVVTDDSGWVARIRCNLVNVTTGENIDTFYDTFWHGDDANGLNPGERQGLAIGSVQTFADETTIDVRCYSVLGTGAGDETTDGGMVSAGLLEAMPIGNLVSAGPTPQG